MSICKYCFDKPRNSNCSCNDDTCEHRVMHCVIRITTKCTQTCRHCCFSCSPECNDMMSVKTAKNINKFLQFNHIYHINIMGGEFFCNPDWFDIIKILSKNMKRVRITTNGDWSINADITNYFIKLCKSIRNIIIGISFDNFHTNKNVKTAISICKNNNIDYTSFDGHIEDAIVPVEKGNWYASDFSMFSCCCKINKYSYYL